MKKLNLQLFALDESAAPLDATAEKSENGTGAAAEQTKAADEPNKDEKKYSDAEVDALFNKKFAKWQAQKQKEIDAAKAEAEKLAKMNAEQKKEYEMEQLRQENEELKKMNLRIELGKTATNLLREHDIDATEDMLGFVVSADAASTKENIDKFVKIVEAQVKKAEVARATGTTPKNYTNNSNPLSEVDKRIAKYQ